MSPLLLHKTTDHKVGCIRKALRVGSNLLRSQRLFDELDRQLCGRLLNDGMDGIFGYLTSHEAYCLCVGKHSGHYLHT